MDRHGLETSTTFDATSDKSYNIMETTPPPLTPLQEHIENIRKKKALRLRIQLRSTYRPEVAEEMRPFFDEAIATAKDVLVPYDMFVGNSVDTVYKKTVDSLKFLGMEAATEEERNKYITLRGAIKFVRLEAGVMIHFDEILNYAHYRVKGVSTAIQQKIVPKRSVNWKEKLFVYEETGAVGSIFNEDNLSLTPEDVAFVKQFIAERGWKGRVDITSIRIIK